MSSEGLVRLVPVSLGDTRLFIEASQIIGTEPGEAVQRNPAQGPPFGWLLGSSDGLEVFDLASILGLGGESPNSPGSVLVLSRMNGELWGLRVEQAAAAITVAQEAIHDLAESWIGLPYQAVVQVEGQQAVLLAADRLHPADRRQPPREDSMAGSAMTLTSAATTSLRMIWISLDQQRQLHLGLSSKQVLEVVEPLPVALVPGSQHALSGFVFYEGEVLPVADLGRWLEVEVSSEAPSRLVIARCSRSGLRVGLTIRSEVRLVELPQAHRPRVVEPERATWVRGVFEVDEGTLLVPDLDALMATPIS